MGGTGGESEDPLQGWRSRSSWFARERCVRSVQSVVSVSKWPVVAMTIYSQPPASRKSQFRASRAPQLASARSAERRSEHRGAPAVPTRQSELMRCLAGLQCGLLPCITAVTGAQWRRRSVRQEHCKRSSACGAARRPSARLPPRGVGQRHVCLHYSGLRHDMNSYSRFETPKPKHIPARAATSSLQHVRSARLRRNRCSVKWDISNWDF